jgi:UPF0755 protein
MTKWTWSLLASGLIAVAVFIGYNMLFVSSAFNSKGTFDIKIFDTSTVSGIGADLIEEGLEHANVFLLLSERMNYRDDNLKDGLYEIDKSLSLVDLIRHLRSGKQKPVNVVVNSIRIPEELAGKITAVLELDSLTFLNYIKDQLNDTFLTNFIPNTYSVYWNISAGDLVKRMKREKDIFWNSDDRMAKAAKLNLSPAEVYTLASIVEMETTINSERTTIASVYLNRLKKGMKLQADPTVVFANGDFSIRRVLNRHLSKDSPYNTYKYEGLPPGPICMPSIASIDAVLDPAKTDYIFFCAKPGYQNGHAFAGSLREHNRNAREYRKWLKKEDIR